MKVRCFRLTPLRSPQRDGILLRVETDRELCGVGEALHVPGSPGESSLESRAALEEVCRELVGSELPAEDALEAEAPRARAWREALSRIGGRRPAARAALDTALLDVVARGLELRVADLLAFRTEVPARSSVPVHGLVAGDRVPMALLEAATAVSAGHGTLELELPSQQAAAVDCVRTVRAAVGEQVRIRADLKGAVPVLAAPELCRELAEHDLEYVAQPVPAEDLDGLVRLRRAGLVPIAAGESAATLAGARRVIERRAADVMLLETSALGGPRAALAIAAAARRAGIGVVVRSVLDGGVGLAAALHVAAVLPGPHSASGLATASRFERDVVVQQLRPERGELALPDGHGLGIAPDPDEIEALRSGPDLVIA